MPPLLMLRSGSARIAFQTFYVSIFIEQWSVARRPNQRRLDDETNVPPVSFSVHIYVSLEYVFLPLSLVCTYQQKREGYDLMIQTNFRSHILAHLEQHKMDTVSITDGIPDDAAQAYSRVADALVKTISISSGEQFKALVEKFKTIYDGVQPTFLCRAPGRVNLIGNVAVTQSSL